jgi:hypothetical protein
MSGFWTAHNLYTYLRDCTVYMLLVFSFLEVNHCTPRQSCTASTVTPFSSTFSILISLKHNLCRVWRLECNQNTLSRKKLSPECLPRHIKAYVTPHSRANGDRLRLVPCSRNTPSFARYMLWPSHPLWQMMNLFLHHHVIQCKLVVGLDRGPLNLMRTTEELLVRNSSGSSLANREYGHRGSDALTMQHPLSIIVGTYFARRQVAAASV